MKKKIIGAVLALCMLISLIPVSAFAAGSPTISVKNVTSETAVGETVTVELTIGNNPGITALGIDLTYDTSVLELTEAAKNGSFMPNNTFTPSKNLTSPYRMLWEDGTSNYDNASETTLCSLTFKVLKATDDGTAAINVEVLGGGFTYEADALASVSFTAKSGSVVVPSTSTPPVTPSADPEILAESKTEETAVGETVTVDLKIKNNPGVTAIGVNLTYDASVLELTEAAKNGSFMPNNTFTPSKTLTSPYRIVWEDGTSNYDDASESTLCSLTFKVLKTTDNGTALINVEVLGGGYTYDEDLMPVSFKGVNGSIKIKVENPDNYLRGDINNDGEVNSKDLTRLMKYLAGENVEVVEAALDVNGDKSVNSKDLTRLMKHLADNSVEIF